MYVNYYFSLLLISVCFSFSVGKIPNEEYASKNETDYVVNKHPGLDGNASAPAVNISKKNRLCKEERVARYRSTPWYSLDDVSINHFGTQKRNSTGHRTHFELHFALQTDGFVDFRLTDTLLTKYYDSINRCALWIGVDQSTRLYYNGPLVQSIGTPDILSSTQFRSFYIKIDDGILQFGMEGDIPLISYPGFDLSSFNYYQFDPNRGPTKIRYCPAAIEESS